MSECWLWADEAGERRACQGQGKATSTRPGLQAQYRGRERGSTRVDARHTVYTHAAPPDIIPLGSYVPIEAADDALDLGGRPATHFRSPSCKKKKTRMFSGNAVQAHGAVFLLAGAKPGSVSVYGWWVCTVDEKRPIMRDDRIVDNVQICKLFVHRVKYLNEL